MKTIDISEEIYSYLETIPRPFNATVNDVLQKVINDYKELQAEHSDLKERYSDLKNRDSEPMIPSENSKPALKERSAKINGNFPKKRSHAISELLDDPRFKTSSGKDKYGLILSAICRENPKRFEEILRFEFGSKRKYFSTSEIEIASSGSNTGVIKIPETSIYALTSLAVENKRKILDQVMSHFGYPYALIERVCRNIPKMNRKKRD